MIICQSNQDSKLTSSGFYINNANANTFLYQEVKRNELQNSLPFFSDLSVKQTFQKWLCPLYCDISLFDNYDSTIAKLHPVITANDGYYFFDLSIEAIPFDPIDNYLSQKFKSFHSMLEINNIDPKRVFFINANLVSNCHYDAWCQQNKINYRIENPILTHQYSLGGFSKPFTKYFSYQDLGQRNIDLAEHSIRTGVKRNYYFTCLMLRPRFHRTAIMLHLLDHQYLSKGIISYFGNQFGHQSAVTVEKEDDVYHLVSRLPSGKRLIANWDQLNKISPLMIDSTLNTIQTSGWAPTDLGFFPRPFIEDTSSLKHRSYFEIVVETHFTNETCLYLTEKTLWAIVSLQPFILVGSPHTLQYLRELGFLSFSPYIDETYDTVNDPSQRMELILKEIDRLCNLSIEEIHEWYSELWPRILHNYHHYFNQSKYLAINEIQKRILSPINLIHNF